MEITNLGKVDTTIDRMIAENYKYNDQSNIDEIQGWFDTKKSKLILARNLQKSYVETWNISVSEVSQLLYLEVSKFDEISNNRCIQVLVELLHDYGLIDKDSNRAGHYVPVSNLKKAS